MPGISSELFLSDTTHLFVCGSKSLVVEGGETELTFSLVSLSGRLEPTGLVLRRPAYLLLVLPLCLVENWREELPDM